jgi:hypothetical protein
MDAIQAPGVSSSTASGCYVTRVADNTPLLRFWMHRWVGETCSYKEQAQETS